MGAVGKTIVMLSWLCSFIGVGLGAFVLIGGLATAKSAPQEAVVAAIACACAILPYCFARAVTEIANILASAKSNWKPDEPRSNHYNYERMR